MGVARALTTVTVVVLTGIAAVFLGASPALADTSAPPAPAQSVPSSASPEPGIPAGFRVAGRTRVATGVERLDLVRDKPPLSIHIARIAPDAPVSLRAVLSNDQVAGPE